MYASLFGVGAPEVLVIGVVALLVFGPKGLAEVARNLGKTLRAFQPTIRELQDVSREFKSTLEKEIGLDDIASSTNNTYKPTSFPNENQQPMVDPNGTPKSEAYTSEDLLKVTQEQLATSAAAATGPQPEGSSPQEHDIVADAPSKVSAPTAPESASQIQSSEKAEKER